jgi:polysaccharide deacetylase family protein (PEP-CTERM system associated)
MVTTLERPTPLARPAASARRNAMSVDVEDYYQVSAFAGAVSRADWTSLPSRVERNTDRVLQIFADSGARATFFVLGWIAERHPFLVRRIVEAGHELASHGYAHVRVGEQTPDQFRADVRRTRAVLQDIGGAEVLGYRAASFSIGADTLWAHAILAEEGYLYSSSVYPVRHDHYGMPDAPRFKYEPASAPGFVEIPLTTLRILDRNIPCSGGGYFRLAPYTLYREALRQAGRRSGEPAVFYFHPWEIDPRQPRPAGTSLRTRFRHYLNLERMEARLGRLLADFDWDRMDRVFGVQ